MNTPAIAMLEPMMPCERDAHILKVRTSEDLEQGQHKSALGVFLDGLDAYAVSHESPSSIVGCCESIHSYHYSCMKCQCCSLQALPTRLHDTTKSPGPRSSDVPSTPRCLATRSAPCQRLLSGPCAHLGRHFLAEDDDGGDDDDDALDVVTCRMSHMRHGSTGEKETSKKLTQQPPLFHLVRL